MDEDCECCGSEGGCGCSVVICPDCSYCHFDCECDEEDEEEG